MKRNLKEQILSLRKEGKTLLEIKQILKCSFSTIAYHLYDKTRKSTIKRISPESRAKYAQTPNAILYNKYIQFFRLGHYYKMSDKKAFSFEELKTLVQKNPTCYLTGHVLDFTKSNGYSLDHKIPLSRGGTTDLSNVGICSPTVNRVKSNLLYSELISLCVQIVRHHNES